MKREVSIEDFNYFWECPKCGESFYAHIDKGEAPVRKCSCGEEMKGTPLPLRGKGIVGRNPFEGFLKKKTPKQI